MRALVLAAGFLLAFVALADFVAATRLVAYYGSGMSAGACVNCVWYYGTHWRTPAAVVPAFPPVPSFPPVQQVISTPAPFYVSSFSTPAVTPFEPNIFSSSVVRRCLGYWCPQPTYYDNYYYSSRWNRYYR